MPFAHWMRKQMENQNCQMTFQGQLNGQSGDLSQEITKRIQLHSIGFLYKVAIKYWYFFYFSAGYEKKIVYENCMWWYSFSGEHTELIFM